ncbi:hypothetical protein, partial [Calidithermus terrae]|uniref:hypothetical protein n=1 Tax=Calidithermus terrae TaxID=1408545 RepID=UPI0011C39B88
MASRLAQRDEILTATAEAVGLLGGPEPHARVPSALARLGEALGLEQVVLFEPAPEGGGFEAIYAWPAPDP